jgi:hypothetical protein
MKHFSGILEPELPRPIQKGANQVRIVVLGDIDSEMHLCMPGLGQEGLDGRHRLCIISEMQEGKGRDRYQHYNRRMSLAKSYFRDRERAAEPEKTEERTYAKHSNKRNMRDKSPSENRQSDHRSPGGTDVTPAMRNLFLIPAT